MQVTLSHDAVSVRGPEVQHFLPALFAPLAARVGKAVLSKVKAAISPAPPEESEGGDEYEEEQDVAVEADGDGVVLSHDRLRLLSDDDQLALLNDVNRIVAEEMAEQHDTMRLLSDLVDQADAIQDDGSPEIAHFKKKLKKLKKLAKKGLKFASPFASFLPGGSMLTGLAGSLGSKKGRAGAAQQAFGAYFPGAGSSLGALTSNDSADDTINVAH